MTDEDRELTVRRLCGWLTLLSDAKRLATLEECCLLERYGSHLHRAVPPELQEVSKLRPQIQAAIWRAKQGGKLKEIIAEINEFKQRLLAVDWARRAMLRAWLHLARQFEIVNQKYRVRCGFPKWAKAYDLAAIKSA